MTTTDERVVAPEDITAQARASFAQASDDRLRHLMERLVHHLHAFVADVDLTEAEWAKGIAVLTDTGNITSDRRQEFILWSDTLGVSMLVDALQHANLPGATESTVLGPFYVPGSPRRQLGSDIAEQEAGTPAWVYGRVLDLEGKPIADAELDVWQNGSNRLYAVQDDHAPDDHLRAKFSTDERGEFRFRAVRPVPYPIPEDGPVGRMLAATGRHPWRPAHIHLVVRADGYHSLTTHIFDDTSTYLDDDTVFAVKPSLVKTFIEHQVGDPEAPRGLEADAYVSLQLDIVLVPSDTGPDPVVDLGRTH